MLRRSVLRPDCTAVRAPGSCRITRYAPSPAGPALRSNRCGKHDDEARWRAPTLGLCSSSPHKSPPAGTARREARVFLPSQTPTAAAKPGPGRTRRACEAPRSAVQLARARSAPRALTWRMLFERSGRRARSEMRRTTRASTAGKSARSGDRLTEAPRPARARLCRHGTQTPSGQWCSAIRRQPSLDRCNSSAGRPQAGTEGSPDKAIASSASSYCWSTSLPAK